uniref:Ig-like domain-containing protein n=1 Tax=Oncorhynchus mykiss TaxID=8022 RepID=A0A8C7LPB6_ONCMY
MILKIYKLLLLTIMVDVIQPDPVIVTQLGQSVSLTCFCHSNLIVRVSWFKQTLGQKPLLMASSFYHTQNNLYSNNFNKDFTETKRLSVKRGVDSFNLTISKTESRDSATYYCVALVVSKVKFGEGTVLIVEGSESNSMSVLQQPVSESVQPGDSVTLNCTIHTETFAGEHSVYWFRHGSGKSHPGIIYNNGDRRDQCEKSPEDGSPTQSCVYNLPKRNLSLSDAGTYYCAVASCWEILFGNGTKLYIEFDDYYPQMKIQVLLSIIRTGVLLYEKISTLRTGLLNFYTPCGFQQDVYVVSVSYSLQLLFSPITIRNTDLLTYCMPCSILSLTRS